MMNEKNFLVSDEIKDIIDESQFFDDPEEKVNNDNSFMIRLEDEDSDSGLLGIILKSSIRSMANEDYKYTFKFLIMPHELPLFMKNMALYRKIALLVGMKEQTSYNVADKIISELTIEQDLVHSGYIITLSYQ